MKSYFDIYSDNVNIRQRIFSRAYRCDKGATPFPPFTDVIKLSRDGYLFRVRMAMIGDSVMDYGDQIACIAFSDSENETDFSNMENERRELRAFLNFAEPQVYYSPLICPAYMYVKKNNTVDNQTEPLFIVLDFFLEPLK
ncbi:MAG: hypothetical protein KCHDKBKB_02990 [Elusimicrobia bacterium]|nr:hypothetical protein [Elusimicrobiota bacterium]